jgi:hypothetical protein
MKDLLINMQFLHQLLHGFPKRDAYNTAHFRQYLIVRRFSDHMMSKKNDDTTELMLDGEET